jgi:cysteine-rich repeat protein
MTRSPASPPPPATARVAPLALALALALAVGAVASCGRCYGPFGEGHPCVDETDCVPPLRCNVGFCLDPGDAALGPDAAALPGCGDGVRRGVEICDDGNRSDGDGCAADCTQVFGADVLNQVFSNRADILFVVDSSRSMCEEQINLRNSFQSFIDGLTAFADVDFHIGVVTTDTLDPAESGRLRNTPVPITNSMDCLVALPPPQDCTTGLPNPLPKILTPATIDIARTFRCIAQVGIGGWGIEAALGAVELALSPPLLADPTANAGFLRDDALLAIVFVGDEDDCSVCNDPRWPGQCGWLQTVSSNLDCSIGMVDDLTPVDTFVGTMAARRPPGRIFAGAIIGLDADGMSQGPVIPDPNVDDQLLPICESPSGRAAPAPRLEDYTRAFMPQARLASICQADFSPSLLDIGMAIGNELLDAVCLSLPPCPGLEREEMTVEVRSGAVLTVLEPADYTLRFNPSCAGGFQLVFAVAPPEGATVTVRYPALSIDGLGCTGYGSG